MRSTSLYVPQSVVRKEWDFGQPVRRVFGLAPLLLVIVAGIACSSVDDIIGRRGGGPTPTAAVFATVTPGGRVSVPLVTQAGQLTQSGLATPTPSGQIVAPVATATAAYATLQAATAMAGATAVFPVFQPAGDCPSPAGPLPPTQPASFSQYPEVISKYLSAGGPPTILEATLRSWGAMNEYTSIQADTDVTGDGVREVIMTVADPTTYRPGTSPSGELLIYGCAQKGYKLLYNTPYSPSTIVPELKRVGDMNGDTRAEVAYTQQTCTATQCTQAMQILSWNATLGIFKPLNDIPMNATSGKVAIADIDKDGILEITISFNPPTDTNAGPPRRYTDIWDWDGVNYILAISEYEPAAYRIHALYDAELLFNRGQFKDAIKMYDRVRDDPNLLPWTLPNESVILRAYATYKKALAQIALKQPRTAADTIANSLVVENPPGTSGEPYATLGQAFMDAYNKSKDRKKACDAVLAVVGARPDVLAPLNSYGYFNRTYTAADMCPFVVK